MAIPLRFAQPIEAEVRSVEETDPDDIVETVIEKLRSGTSPVQLLTASALAVSRSTELPAEHHGGPIHPVSGIHSVYKIAERLGGDWAWMPVIHSVALANKHIHAPELGPAIMPEIGIAEHEHDDPGATREGLANAMRCLWPGSAQRHLVMLLNSQAPGEVLDVMLDTVIRRNALDDHYFLYLVNAARALDCVGWEWAPVILRPPARYLSTNMMAVAMPDTLFTEDYVADNLRAYHGFGAIEALLDTYRLLEIDVAPSSDQRESEAIGALGVRIADCDDYAEIPEMLAEALARGLSLEGAGEALSIGAATIHLRTNDGSPFDVHLHTGVNARRYLLGVPGVSLRNKVLGLLSWSTGPEVRWSQSRRVWSERADEATMAALSDGEQGALFEELIDSILHRPPIDVDAVGGQTDLLVAGPEVQKTMALAQQCADKGYDPEPLFERLGEITCRDNHTEMHAFKHLQAAIEEYQTTRQAYRWVHLVSAAKTAVCTYGIEQTVYEQAREHLAI